MSCVFLAIVLFDFSFCEAVERQALSCASKSRHVELLRSHAAAREGCASIERGKTKVVSPNGRVPGAEHAASYCSGKYKVSAHAIAMSNGATHKNRPRTHGTHTSHMRSHATPLKPFYRALTREPKRDTRACHPARQLLSTKNYPSLRDGVALYAA